ncbi:MAG: hypothetical protein HRU15_07780, partial [Planctomycetes bacterium]|nr:hypothetical protein [Planctomycetota bacterium]
MRFVMTCLLMICVLCCASGEEKSFGTFQGKLSDETGQQYMQYQATVPQGGRSAHGKPLGLIVALHGINGHERQLVGSLAKTLAATKLQNDYMGLG